VDAYSHLNIGAGRIVWQDIVRIDVEIKKRQFHKNDVILESFKHAKDTNGRLHLLGLVRNSTSSAPRAAR
jgi:2,3-bisphosphoglycerate-independent phosphoglycerate mutase